MIVCLIDIDVLAGANAATLPYMCMPMNEATGVPTLCSVRPATIAKETTQRKSRKQKQKQSQDESKSLRGNLCVCVRFSVPVGRPPMMPSSMRRATYCAEV